MNSMIMKTFGLITLGAIGGWLTSFLPVPLPWMLGSLITVGLVASLLSDRLFYDYQFPNRFRSLFVGLIGVMIGSQVSPDLLGQLRALPVTLPALLMFVVLAHCMNYALFRKLGGMDKTTAFYSGAPGGLLESLLLGEAAGAKVSILTMMQFLRIICVITIVPVGLSVWVGHPVGSAAGQSYADDPATTLSDVIIIVAVAVVGLWSATFLHLPAAQLIGPLLLAAGLSLMGVLDGNVPGWMVATAQVVIGTSLGLRFRGLAPDAIGKAMKLSLLSVGLMLLLGFGLAILLARVTDLHALHLLIGFAPGGVTEMSIIALSLAANPTLVSVHHVVRILMTVAIMDRLARFLGVSQD